MATYPDMPSSAAAQPAKRTPSSNTERPIHRRVEDDEVRPYVIVSDLGKGSFATVYRGYHEVRTSSVIEIVSVYRRSYLP